MILSIIGLLIALTLFVAWANWQVSHFAAPYLSDNTTKLPETKVALLLGTVPKLSDGQPNLYFQFRIQAAADLYQRGRVRHIIASGDNSRRDYNEPDAMKEALIAHGVPASAITADYAGLRTLDSIVRARDIFGQQSYIIVSQQFHNERAVYLARQHGIAAFGYNAHDVEISSGFKTRTRELGARVKMFWDLWTGTEPKFGGEKIELPD
ncbi:SanA/YdcF family protein [Neisseriaceae bacterium B1]